MKKLHLALVAIAAVIGMALPAVSNASLINITINPNTGLPVNDIDKGLLGNNSPTTNFDALVTDVSLFESFSGTNLPDPMFAGFEDDAPGTVDLTGFDYAVLHYGKGRGGAGQGGGIVFFYLNGMTGNFNFASLGSGPNGFGGLSSIRLFVGAPGQVPDSGSTVALLGAALTGLGVMRRFVKR